LENRMQNILSLAGWLSSQVGVTVELKAGNKVIGGATTADQRVVLRNGTVHYRESSTWGVLENDIELTGIPEAIAVSPDAQMAGLAAITYRYPVTAFSPWQTIGYIPRNLQRVTTFKFADDGTPTINHIQTKIQGGNLQSFATPYYSGYYTNILTPRDLAISPDLKYLYVADWELFLVFGYGGQYGDKVGVIR